MLLVLCAATWGTDYVSLERSYRSGATASDKQTVLSTFLSSKDGQNLNNTDPSLQKQIQKVVDEDSPSKDDQNQLTSMLRSRARLQGSFSAPPDAVMAAKDIKSSKLFMKDKGTVEDSNWVQQGLQHLTHLIPNFNFQPPESRRPTGGIDPFSVLRVLFILVILLLVGGLLYFAISQFKYRSSLKRKASAMLEEDEPERTADEWLQLADGLTRQGRYREAVRCLYLACLLRLDEAGVIRFSRNETNWEHLGRLQTSPKRPEMLDFTAPTRAFDQVWYGRRVRGIEDVEQFKAWYLMVLECLGRKAA